MEPTAILVEPVIALAALYLLVVAALILVGRRSDALALARFIPDCVVLMRRLLGDPRVPRRGKAILIGLVAYLATPIDLVPDLIPVAGQLDDLLIAALAVRYAMRVASLDLLREPWPGPTSSLDVVIRLAYGKHAGHV